MKFVPNTISLFLNNLLQNLIAFFQLIWLYLSNMLFSLLFHHFNEWDQLFFLFLFESLLIFTSILSFIWKLLNLTFQYYLIFNWGIFVVHLICLENKSLTFLSLIIWFEVNIRNFLLARLVCLALIYHKFISNFSYFLKILRVDF